MRASARDVMMSRRRHFTSATRHSGDDDGRVVSFRPRRAKMVRMDKWRKPAYDRDRHISVILNLAKFEVDAREDDYTQRMIMNGLAFVVLLVLIVIGIWLAANINDQHHALRARSLATARDSADHRMMLADGR